MTDRDFEQRLLAGAISLDEVADRIWLHLEDGASGRLSGFHTPILATAGADGTPQARVVVLRHADRNAGTLRLHTDIRSTKVGELRDRTQVTLVAYDPGEKTQIRVAGAVRLHHDDEVAREAWDRSTAFARRCYTSEPGPGTEIVDPSSGLPAAVLEAPISDEDVEVGYANFCLLVLEMTRVDWLYLTVDGNRSARFTRDADGGIAATWRIP